MNKNHKRKSKILRSQPVSIVHLEARLRSIMKRHGMSEEKNSSCISTEIWRHSHFGGKRIDIGFKASVFSETGILFQVSSTNTEALLDLVKEKFEALEYKDIPTQDVLI